MPLERPTASGSGTVEEAADSSAAETRYRLLVEHAPMAVWVHDGTTLLFANQAFATLLGASDPSAIIGRAFSTIVPPAIREVVRSRVEAIKAGRDATPVMEGGVVRLDGVVVPVDIMAIRCEFAGRPAIQAAAIDVSERHRAQKERAELESQLRHAQRMDALGTLAGGIAHDFNNVLAIILARTTLMERQLEADHPARESVDEVVVAAERAAALVRRILSFSRKEPQQRAPVRLAQIAEEVARLMRSTLPASIRVDVEPGPDDLVVVADPTQVHQALMNLCTNAAQAIGSSRAGVMRMSVEGVGLDSSELAGLPHGAYARVTVSDDGVGIDPHTLDRIFDPFFTTRRVGEGAGLGLSIVHGIMKGHDGAVRVTSRAAEGTTFQLLFPVNPTVASSERERAPDTAPLSAAPVIRADERPRVLLVDDEASLATSLRQILSAAGFVVSAHAQTESALEELRRSPDAFDLVLTDHDMPGSSGLEVAREVRRLRPTLPVVLTSGHVTDQVRGLSAELGVDEIVAKPFSIPALLAVLERLARTPR